MRTRGSLEKRRKTKKIVADQQTFFFIFHWEPLVSLSCAWWKGTFLLIFECFWSFSAMRTHAQACIRWSKYTTLVLSCLILSEPGNALYLRDRNSYFFLLQGGSIAVLAVGIWTVVDKSFIEVLLRNNLFMSAAYIMIFTGCCATIVSFLGCYGALKVNKCYSTVKY